MTSKLKNILESFLILSAVPVLASCDMIYDDMDPCHTSFRLKFVYDYNMSFADAFAHDVTSVDVWVFDDSGKLVWTGRDSGDSLSSGNYTMELPLPDGTYDIVSWCGLENNDNFNLDAESPSSMGQLGVSLDLAPVSRTDFGDYVSDKNLSPLFHSVRRGIELKSSPSENEVKIISLPLVKDTHYIQVMLQNINGEPLKSEDFSICITAANQKLDWENNVVSGQPQFSYTPWNVMYGEAGIDKDMSGETITSVSTLLSELSTSRLMADASIRLVVTRLADNTEIIRIPLIDNLLLIKGHYYDMSDQEFLDRKGDFSLTFFLDSNLSWNITSGIYIQNWAVVPVQETDL